MMETAIKAPEVTTVNKIWQYLQDDGDLWMLSTICNLARELKYVDDSAEPEYYMYQGNPITFWERNALFAMIILAAEGEL